MSWKITHVRPPLSTSSVASSCQHAFGAGYTNRRHAERGFFFGSDLATPAWRKIRANDATEGTGSSPIACILSCTLIGPRSSPEASRAARTCTAWALTASVNCEGLDLGRLDLGSSTAAGPSTCVRLRSS